MKKNVVKMIVVVLCAVFCCCVEGHAETAKADKKAIIQFIKKNYGADYKIRIKAAEKTTDKEIMNRAGKKVVYVDMFKTKSTGKGGRCITKGPFYARYFKYVKREKPGKKIKVYLIYTPYNNSIDGVDAVVSGGKIKY